MINLYKQEGETLYGIKEFIIDSLEDIKNLPKNVRVGSMAIIIPTGQVYIFNGEKKWTPIGNSSSEDSDNDEIVDTSETSSSST